MADWKQGIVYVYDKDMNLIARFGEELQGAGQGRVLEGLSENAMRNQMVTPTVHIEQNGTSTFSFQMLANSEKWQEIKDPRNIYFVNGRYYTPLTEGAYEYSGEDTARIVTATLVESWYLLKTHYNQAYNCGIYTYAKATFDSWVNDGARFIIKKSDCSNSGETITNQNAWTQVKKWTRTNDSGNVLSYVILTDNKHKATNWDNVPAAVAIKSFEVDEDKEQIAMTIETKANATVKQVFEYSNKNSYRLTDNEGNAIKPVPAELTKVEANVTTITEDADGHKVYVTMTQSVDYTYNNTTGIISIKTSFGDNVVNGITAEYKYNNIGDIKAGATCWFAYGAEVVDEHTFVILPKANSKYKLTINNVEYEDSEVKDGRGVIMPRGSAGYAMWAALKGSDWGLGICDVLAKDFDPNIDYGVFNVETDMQDTLSNVQAIQSLYGGILDWDSEHKILNYRAENSEDYQAYEDGFNDWTGYVFREGKNITDAPVITYDNNIITKAYVLGYGNLNIRAVNDGKSYIENKSFTTETHEGYLTQELIYDTNDEGGQKQLLYWGKKELAKKCKPRKTIAISATDIRTVEGMEHEVFDINDIVKVYYHDEQDNSEVVEQQRIILWEYDVFAMWDCTVEVGEKTQNDIELFKLVYNKSLSTPNANGSGEIASTQISFKSWDSDYSSEYNPTTLAGQFQYFSQTTTENTDALAALATNTNNLYADVQLFAQYQKQTANLFTQTYAGLQAYADETSAEVLTIAQGYFETLDGKITTTAAGLSASISNVSDQVQAQAALFAGVGATTGYVQVEAGERKSSVTIWAESGFQGAKVTVAGNYAVISTANYIRLDAGGSEITIGNLKNATPAVDGEGVAIPSGGLYYGGTQVGWTSIRKSGTDTTWSVLGQYGQNEIVIGEASGKVPGYFS